MDKIVIVVKRGMVDSVYSSKGASDLNVEVIDLDTTEPEDGRKNQTRLKKAKKTLKQIQIY